MKANCLLLVASLVKALTPSTLWITDGHQGRAEAPKVRGHAFELIIEEPRATSNVFTCMHSFIILSS